ncbi:hypothetical protein C2I18_03985 [Paenibacillus sp. PK3_47]|nr:hypothetical protein C2I18_03985 [Paenibacillus sp. PK3_47]
MNQSGNMISSVEEWLKYAPPAKRELHWQEGRSAYELAHSWLGEGQPQTPVALLKLLNGSGLVPADLLLYIGKIEIII